MVRMVVRVMVMIGSISMLVSAFPLLSRTHTLFFRHTDFHFNILILSVRTVTAAATATAASGSEGKAHFQGAAIVPFFLKRDFENNWRLIIRRARMGCRGLLVMVGLFLFMLLPDQSLGSVGVFPLYARLHVFQFSFLSGQNVSVLGAVFAQGHFGGGVDFAVGCRLVSLRFSAPVLRAAWGGPVFLGGRGSGQTHEPGDGAF